MEKVTPITSRKSDHIKINLEQDVRSSLTTGLERYRFIHQALPELNLDDVSTSLRLFDRQLRIPLLISSMTGGTAEAAQINMKLAEAAQHTCIAMGLGSQRVAIDHPKLASTFQVRQVAPDILLLANLGAIQLNYGYSVDECKRAVDMIEADALILHLNPLQEAVQPEGDTRFAGLLSKIEKVCKAISVPVIAKEVGWGFSETAARQLVDAGVSAIDVAGAGGTSWSQVEMHRAQNESQARLAAAFQDWGISTVESIQNILNIAPEINIIASGGLRNGVDIAKCIALGAILGGMASPFLKSAVKSVDETIQRIHETQRQIQVCMFAVGAKNLNELNNTKIMATQG